MSGNQLHPRMDLDIYFSDTTVSYNLFFIWIKNKFMTKYMYLFSSLGILSVLFMKQQN